VSRAFIEIKGEVSPKLNNILLFRIEKLIEKGIAEVDIAIESGGGSSEAGIEAYTFFKSYNDSKNISINTINLFTCASSAVMYFLGGKVKTSIQGGNLLIHEGVSCLQGNYKQRELQERLLMLENINNKYISILENNNIEITKEQYYQGISLSDRRLSEMGVIDKISDKIDTI